MGIYLYFLLSPSQFPVGPSKISHSKSSQNKLNEEMIKIFKELGWQKIASLVINIFTRTMIDQSNKWVSNIYKGNKPIMMKVFVRDI